MERSPRTGVAGAKAPLLGAGIVLGLLLASLAPSASAFPRPDDASHADCVLCAGEGGFDCPTCSGVGMVLRTCELCRGQGKVDCSCRDAARGMFDPKMCPACRGEQRACRLCEMMKSRRAPDPGYVTCPNVSCESGMVKFSFGVERACLVCRTRKSQVECSSCKGGRVECSACASVGKERVPCPDCVGTTTLACPFGADVRSIDCIYCRGTRHRTCSVVARGTRLPEPLCRTCAGSGLFPCSSCRGLGRHRCDHCNGTGSENYVIVNTVSGSRGRGGVRSCNTCMKTGVYRCHSCDRGRTECGACKGSGRITAHCGVCREGASMPCQGCRTPGASLVTIARILEEKGRASLAVPWLERAEFLLEVALGSLGVEEGRGRSEEQQIARDWTRRKGEVEEKLKSLRSVVVSREDEGRPPLLAVGSGQAAELAREAERAEESATPEGRDEKESTSTRQEPISAQEEPARQEVAKDSAEPVRGPVSPSGTWKTLSGSRVTVSWQGEELVAEMESLSRPDTRRGRQLGQWILRLRRSEEESGFDEGEWMTEEGRLTAETLRRLLDSGEMSNEAPVWRMDEEGLMWDHGVEPLTVADERGPLYEGRLRTATDIEVEVLVVFGRKGCRVRPRKRMLDLEDDDRLLVRD